MRILIIGTVKFSEIVFLELISMGANVVGVCTSKEPEINSDHVNLKAVADKHKVACLETQDVNDQKSLHWIRKRQPSVIFCFGWSKKIGQNILGIPTIGVIGFHPAMLPINRGRHPIIWALVLGLSETASTFFFMDEGFDSGDILSQSLVPIKRTDDAGILYQRICETAVDQIREFVPRLASGTFSRTKQNESLANSWRKRSFLDGEIDWRMSADSIYDLVRALSKPYVGAHFSFHGDIVKVWSVMVEKGISRNIEPGKVLDVCEGKILVKAGIHAVWLTSISPEISIKPGIYI